MNLRYLFLFIITLFFLNSIFSVNYYVDATNGNDSNSGLTELEPLKTISKINSMSFNPGDNVLFKRSEMWRENLRIQSSGEINNPITFGAYGLGEKPIINPSKIISNWRLHQGNIYVANVSSSVKTLIVDTNFYDIAHHPNNGYIKVAEDSTDFKSFKTVETGLNYDQIINSDIRLKYVNWWVKDYNITSYDETTRLITINEELDRIIKKDFGYFFINKFWMLDQEKEWYYNSSNNKLYVWFENSDNPSNYFIEVPFSESGIYVDVESNIVIKDLEIKNSQSYGIYLRKGVNYKLNNIKISNSGDDGIYVRNWNTPTVYNEIINSEFKNNLRNGARLDYVNDVLVENNLFENNGVLSIPINSNAGLKVNGDNLTVRNNIILNSGYNGLMYHGNNNLIEKNFINNTCIVLDDCGLIYTGGNNSKNNIVRNNILLNAIGNNDGVPKYSGSNGIYFDDKSGFSKIENNIIFDVRNYGIFLHNSRNNIVSGNIVYNAGETQLLFSEGHNRHPDIGPSYLINNEIFNNTFCAINDSQIAIRKSSLFQTIDFANFYNNTYCYTKDFIKISYKPDYLSLGVLAEYHQNTYSFLDWQNLFNKDLDSINLKTDFEINNFIINNYSSNLIVNGGFNTSKDFWSNGWSNPSGLVFSIWKEDCLLGFEGCLETYTSREIKNKRDILTTSSRFPMTKGLYYLIEFSLLSNISDSSFIVVRRNGDPNYDSLGFQEWVNYNTSIKNFKELFLSSGSNSEARIDFQSGLNNFKLQIDNVSLRQVNISSNDVTDDLIFLVNTDFNNKKTFNLNKKYCDLDQNIIEDSIELNSFESKILFSCFCNNDYVCNNYENHSTCSKDCELGEGYIFNNTIINTTNTTIPDDEKNETINIDPISPSNDEDGGSINKKTKSTPSTFTVTQIQNISINDDICIPQYNYYDWSLCEEGLQTQFIEDLNFCSGDILQERICQEELADEQNLLLNAKKLDLTKFDYKKYESSLDNNYNEIFYVDNKLEDQIFLLKDNNTNAEYLGQYFDIIDGKVYYTLKRVDEGIITILQEEGILDLEIKEENNNLIYLMFGLLLLFPIIFGIYYFLKKKNKETRIYNDEY